MSRTTPRSARKPATISTPALSPARARRSARTAPASGLRERARARSIKDSLTGSAFYRIGQIHQKLCNEETFTTETLAAELEVSVRTIKRDIDIMRDSLGVPVEWSPARHSFVLTRPCSTLPLLCMNAREALVLALVAQMHRRLAGAAIGQVFAAMLEKVAPVFGRAVAARVDAVARVLAPATSMSDQDLDHFFALLEATLERRVVRFDHHKPGAARPERRLVHPLLLQEDKEGWLLHAYDTARKEVRTFDLVRIRSLHTTATIFEPPAGVDVRKRARHGYGRYTGNEADVCTVRIALDPTAAAHARAKPWHDSQQLTDRPDGGAEITLQVSHLAGVKRDILSWGNHVEVREPAALRADVRATLQSTLARYATT